MKYACKVNLPNEAYKFACAGNLVTTYGELFCIHETDNHKDIVSFLPKSLQSKKMGIYVTKVDLNKGHKELKPHKHSKEDCVLNFYLKTNGEETIFYEGEEFYLDIPEKEEAEKTHKILSLDSLKKIESFIAKDNEVWLLKTSQVHALIPKEKHDIREMLQIFFYEGSYDEILKLLDVENATH